MPAPPPLAGYDLATAVVRVGGHQIDGAFQIVRIETVKQINRIPQARLVLIDGGVDAESFPISQSSAFLPGKSIEIALGYHDDASVVFKGVIEKQGVRVTRARECRLTVTCCDKAAAMTIAKRSAQFDAMSDEEALRRVISSHGLTADVDIRSAAHSQKLQYNATDWDYVVARAEANGAIALVDDGKVTIRQPATSDPQYEIDFGSTLIDIDIEMDSRSQLASVEAATWDMATQAVIKQPASEPSWRPQGNLSGETLAETFHVSDFTLRSAGALSDSDLSTWANAQLLKSRMSRIRGHATFVGIAGLKVGQFVKLKGVGARFNGDAFVSRVQHVAEAGVWKTEASFGLSPQWFGQSPAEIHAPPAGGLVPAARGLQIGTVKQIHGDPDGQYRVKVALPLIETESEGLWMRLARPYASDNAGHYFMPEVGDEVVVGFLDDDPAAPVALGSLHSSPHKTPFIPESKNAEKGIVTKGDLKIVFDDDKKSILVETPKGQSILISDDKSSITVKDCNGNQLTMSDSGVAIKSPHDIELSASGSVKISGDMGVSVASSGGDVALKGLNASVKGDVSASVEGAASATVKSSGELTVKGALVMIN